MQTNADFKVILLTCYPPPYGGVSVLSRRLFEGLRSRGIDVEVASQNPSPAEESVEWIGRYRRWLWGQFCRRPGRKTIVHYMMDSWRIRAWIGRLAKLGTFRCVFSANNARAPQMLASHSALTRLLWRRAAMAGRSHWVAVSGLVYSQLRGLGIPENRLATIPSFLPPLDREINASLPDDMQAFIDNHDPVLSSVAFRLEFHDGEDLYGADLCIRATQALRERHPKIGFIFFVPDPGDRVYLEKLKTMITEHGVGENFMLYDRPVDQLCPLWKQSSIFVRATNTDGDPLSVREALCVGTPVVASDVSPRPAPCVLFRNRDLDNFIESLDSTLLNLEANAAIAREFGDPTNALDSFIELYRKVVGLKTS